MRKSGIIKEDERIEGIIRGLLKLPENRKCINCNSLGPQYVCTTFLTFVCMNCSGVHREFTHRVKSVSMAKFSADEVSALQAAGNERARQIYLKSWDPQRNSYPDSSNLNRIREFIKHVYVDRRYSGEKTDKLPRLRLGVEEDPYESRNVAAYLGEIRSPRYESRYEESSSGRYQHCGRTSDRSSGYYIEERRNPGYYIEERRSPGYNQENPRFGGHRQKNPVRFEIVDDRFRDDLSGSRRRYDSRSLTNRDHKTGSRSPECQKNTNSSWTLVVRPIKDILGENAPSLEIGKYPKAFNVGKHPKEIDGKDADDSVNNQKIAPSGSQKFDDENPVEQKNAHSETLFNSNTDPEPTDTAVAAPQIQPITPSDGDNKSSNEPPVKEKGLVAPPPNTLEFLLFELGAPFMQSSNNTPSNVSGSNTPAVDAVPSNLSTSTTASTPNTQSTGGNMPEASVSPTTPAPIEQMLMLPSCADTCETASTTPIQQFGGRIPPDGASPAVTSGQMSTLPGSFSGSINASTTNLLEQPSGGDVPGSSASPAPSLGKMSTLPNSVGNSTTLCNAIVPVSFFNGGPPQDAPDISVDSAGKVPDVQQLNGLQQHQPLASSAVGTGSFSAQQTTPIEPPNNQPWASLLVPSNQGHSSASSEQSSLALLKPAQDTSLRVGSGCLEPETKSTGRKELPADLFTASYFPVHTPVSHWQTGHAHAMGFNTQYYPNAMASQLAPAYSNPAKSSNPFDIGSDTTPAQVLPFPSMASLQGALPNAGSMSMSNADGNSLGLTMQQSLSYVSAMRPLSPPFSPDASPSACMGQQMHMNMQPNRVQGIDGFGGTRAVYGSSNTPQQPTTATNSYSMGGNPFG